MIRGPLVFISTDSAAPNLRGLLVGLGYPEPRRIRPSTLLGLLGLAQRRAPGSFHLLDDRDAQILGEAERELADLILDAGAWLELDRRLLDWSRARRLR